MDNSSKKIVALLGPTNTGKTFVAIEKMLEYRSGIFGLPLRLLAREVYEKITKKIGAEKVALITDGRFSGGTHGFSIGHVGPEAAVGGPIGLLKDGDVIEIDTVKGSLNVILSDEELKLRRSKWKPKVIEYTTGTLWKYSQSVGPAFEGAVTHPGASKEKKCYADI